MEYSEVIDRLGRMSAGSAESLGVFQDDDFWRMGDAGVFRVARYLCNNERPADVLRVLDLAEMRGFDLGERRAMSINFMRGDALLDLGRFEEAIEAYGRLVGLKEERMPYNNMGLALWGMGEYEAALSHYLKDLEIGSRDPIPLRGVGEMLIKLERDSEAIPYLIEAIELRPDYMFAIRALGVAYYNLEEWAEAYRAMRRVRQIDPKEPLALKVIDIIEKAFE